MIEQMTSRKNPLLVHIRKLAASRPYRRGCGETLGEGIKLLAEALRWGAELTAVVFAAGTELPPIPEGVRLVEVPEDVLASVSTQDSPQGVSFLWKQPPILSPEKLAGSRYLVLDGLQDPGNVGAIWRTADALGADGLLLVNGCADPFSPKTVRASMGACFRLPVYELTAEELPPLLERSGLPLYATALREDTVDVREARLSRCAAVIGSEGSGVSQRLLELSEKTLKIPMRARCESLNAAAAACVLLWEMARENGPGLDPSR